MFGESWTRHKRNLQSEQKRKEELLCDFNISTGCTTDVLTKFNTSIYLYKSYIEHKTAIINACRILTRIYTGGLLQLWRRPSATEININYIGTKL
jgi:hypothetical protein